MRYTWLDDYCLAKKCVKKDFKEEWQVTRYLIGGKMFAMQGGDKENKPIITLKLEPSYGEFLRDEYADIVPRYYMNKRHWNSLYLEGNVPDQLLKEMLDQSYRIVLESLSKNTQKEVEET